MRLPVTSVTPPLMVAFVDWHRAMEGRRKIQRSKNQRFIEQRSEEARVNWVHSVYGWPPKGVPMLCLIKDDSALKMIRLNLQIRSEELLARGFCAPSWRFNGDKDHVHPRQS